MQPDESRTSNVKYRPLQMTTKSDDMGPSRSVVQTKQHYYSQLKHLASTNTGKQSVVINK